MHISPVIFWFVINHIKTEGIKFSAKDLMLVIMPGIILWLGILAYYNTEFVNAAMDMARYNAQPGRHVGYLSIDPWVLQYVTVVIFFSTLFF